MQGKIVVVLKGYPRLSETFIAQELRGLERAGLRLVLVSLRQPTDTKRHPVHDEIAAPVFYLPEYLHREPLRVMRAFLAALPRAGFWRTLPVLARDYLRDPTRNRLRRFGQALVLTAEWPRDADWLHSHFIHTPASVTSYASDILSIPWTASAHAKDIWTSPRWDLEDKLRKARWVVTCTASGHAHLKSLNGHGDRVHLSYHGLDLDRFAPFSGGRPRRDGSDPARPAIILSVGRAVAKKGYETLLEALALLPPDLHWRFVHIGNGSEMAKLKTIANALSMTDRIIWRGSRTQSEVLMAYRNADIFALASRISHDGDRDGLPNVLVEAASQKLACVSTNISGIPELLTDGVDGLIVPPENPKLLAEALARLIRDPALRQKLGDAAEARVRMHFDHGASIRQLVSLFAAERGAKL